MIVLLSSKYKGMSIILLLNSCFNDHYNGPRSRHVWVDYVFNNVTVGWASAPMIHSGKEATSKSKIHMLGHLGTIRYMYSRLTKYLFTPSLNCKTVM